VTPVAGSMRGDDLLGRVVGDGLDVHAAFGRDDEGDAADRTVDQERAIELAVDVGAVFDIEAVDLLAGVAGLAVTSVLPSISLAFLATTSSIDLARRTPPLASGPSSLNLPLPRPPAWIWLFTT
jgi:hypothetical protein